MSEIIQDEKKRKKTIIIAAVIAVLVFAGLAFFINSKQKKALPPPPPPKIDLVGKQDTAKDSFIKQSSAQMKEQDNQIKDLQKQLEEMKKGNKAPAAGSPGAPGFPSIPPPPPPTTGADGQNIPYAPGSNFPLPGASPGTSAAPVGKEKMLSNLIALESQKVKDDKSDPKKSDAGKEAGKGDDKTKPSSRISAGSFVKAVLLNGLDAPSGSKGKGAPYPVLFRVTDLAQLPNKFRADVRECFAIGEAYGELSSERAMIRINYLSCVAKKGANVEAQVSGYVVGEDGKLGMSGTVVTKQGALLQRSMIAGFLQGVSQAFAQSASVVNIQPTGNTTTIDPNKTVQAGIGGGLTKATEELSKFYIDMAREMFPVVEVNAGRKVELVFMKPVMLKEEAR